MNMTGFTAMKDLEEIKISCYGRSVCKFTNSQAPTVHEARLTRLYSASEETARGCQISLSREHAPEDDYLSSSGQGIPQRL